MYRIKFKFLATGFIGYGKPFPDRNKLERIVKIKNVQYESLVHHWVEEVTEEEETDSVHS